MIWISHDRPLGPLDEFGFNHVGPGSQRRPHLRWRHGPKHQQRASGAAELGQGEVSTKAALREALDSAFAVRVDSSGGLSQLAIPMLRDAWTGV